MFVTVVVVAACSFAGGYFVQFSAAVEDWRLVWVGREATAIREFSDADKFSWAVPWRGLRSRVWPLIRLKAWGAVTCGTCFGWHTAWAVLALQAILAAWAGEAPLVSVSEAPLVWGAACGVHTGIFKLAVNHDLLKEE